MLACIDYETGLSDSGHQAPEPVSLQWAREDGTFGMEVDHAGIESVLEDILRNDTVVAHPIGFEWGISHEWYPRLHRLLFDRLYDGHMLCTMTTQRLIAIAKGLGYTNQTPGLHEAMRFWGIPVSGEKGGIEKKAALKKYGSLHNTPPSELPWRLKYELLRGVPLCDWPPDAVEYAQQDPIQGLQLCLAQRHWLEENELPTEQLEIRANVDFANISTWGIMVDGARVIEVSDGLEAEFVDAKWDMIASGLILPTTQRDKLKMLGIERKEYKILRLSKSDADLMRTVDRTFDLSTVTLQSKKQALKDLLTEVWDEDALGEMPRTKPTKNFPDGQLKTDADTLLMAGSGNVPAFAHVKLYTLIQKTLSTYIRVLLEARGLPIHAFFKSLGAATSRSSCGKPNLQNQPTKGDVRSLYIPRPGHVFIACDYKTQELRTLAQVLYTLWGDNALARRYQQDPEFDAHQAMASNSGLSRQEAKAANFGFPGGLGFKRFVGYARGYGLDLTTQQAKEIKDAWFAQWPEMSLYFEYISAITDTPNGGEVIVPTSGFTRGGCYFTDGCNTGFQALGAHCTKNALFEVSRRCLDPKFESALLGSRVVNFIHDELILEVPDFVAQLVAPEVERLMEAAMDVYCPDVPNRAAATIMVRWLKGAEHQLLRNGTRRVWTHVVKCVECSDRGVDTTCDVPAGGIESVYACVKCGAETKCEPGTTTPVGQR